MLLNPQDVLAALLDAATAAYELGVAGVPISIADIKQVTHKYTENWTTLPNVPLANVVNHRQTYLPLANVINT